MVIPPTTLNSMKYFMFSFACVCSIYDIKVFNKLNNTNVWSESFRRGGFCIYGLNSIKKC